ncbi:MAG: cytochrome c oxidase subunit II [Alphaproteobacteria bacterium]|nr:cytochrome c oxidase subunit II [Alphaproteobacteria bacterium]
MKKICFWILAALVAGTAATLAFPALAAGGPVPGALGMPEAATPVAERIHDFHNLLLWIITAITVFVMILLLIIIVRFNSKANPKPAQFTHNVGLEVAWTVIPVIILIIIAVPSLKLLYYGDRTHTPEMTLKVTGYQWYWGYEYPDHEGLSFMAYMVPDDQIDASKGQHRLLSTDNEVVLPIDTDIQILVTAADVLHSFAVPAFGIKTDAVPGRTNETWVRITKPGVYFGQCSELCGKDHGFMPIQIRAVTKEEFEAWLITAKEEFASLSNEVQPVIQLAQAEVTE